MRAGRSLELSHVVETVGSVAERIWLLISGRRRRISAVMRCGDYVECGVSCDLTVRQWSSVEVWGRSILDKRCAALRRGGGNIQTHGLSVSSWRGSGDYWCQVLTAKQLFVLLQLGADLLHDLSLNLQILRIRIN